MGLFQSLFKEHKPEPDRTEEILRRHLDHDFVVFPMAESAASTDQLNAVAERFSVSFPVEFVAHVCGRFPGVYVEVKEAVWPRPQLYDVGPFWSFLYGIHTFTPCPSSEDWMRLDHVAQSFQESRGLLYVPILQVVGDADVYCVDSKGGIGRYDHETGVISPDSRDFWSLFDDELEQLKKRKLQKVALA